MGMTYAPPPPPSLETVIRHQSEAIAENLQAHSVLLRKLGAKAKSVRSAEPCNGCGASEWLSSGDCSYCGRPA